MNRISRLFIVSFLVLIISGSANAQKARKYSNEFLAIGVSPRALSMSNSVVAHVDDVTAGYWNPAGIARAQEDIQLSFMHSEYFAGIANYDYGAIAVKINKQNSLGLSMIRFGVDNILNTLDLVQNGQVRYDRVKTFSAVDYGFLVSFSHRTNITGIKDGEFQKAKKLSAKNPEGFYYGGNVKIIHRKVGAFATAWGFGLDVGAQYNNAKGWNFGAVAKDVNGTFNAWSFNWKPEEQAVLQQTGNDIPSNSLEITLPRLILGAGKKININKKIYVLVESDVDLTFDGKRTTLVRSGFSSIDPHMGVETGIADILFIRAGIGNIQRIPGVDGKNSASVVPTIGVGLKLKSLYIDYALANVGGALYSNSFSLKIGINKEKQ